MIERSEHLGALRRLMARFPVVGLLGARQVGKTTLAQSLARSTSGPVTRFALEDPGEVARRARPLEVLALKGQREARAGGEREPDMNHEKAICYV